jgi:hypothetical protein
MTTIILKNIKTVKNNPLEKQVPEETKIYQKINL